MNRHGHKGRTDANHTAVLEALRGAGWSATSTASVGDGFPDIICGAGGMNMLIEVKDGTAIPSRRKLTPDEASFHQSWKGLIFTCESPESAVSAVLDILTCKRRRLP